MNRTNLDFSQHVLTIVQNDDNCEIYRFEKPNTSWDSFVFIIAEWLTIVGGDYGNWIFDRPFSPSKITNVSDSYWCEKLRLSSTQKSHDFDSAKTIKHIQELIQENSFEYSFEELEYLNECKKLAEGSEWEYSVYAYNELPDNWTAEDVPFGTIINPQLLRVFDAFEEIAKRIEKNKLFINKF